MLTTSASPAGPAPAMKAKLRLANAAETEKKNMLPGVAQSEFQEASRCMWNAWIDMEI